MLHLNLEAAPHPQILWVRIWRAGVAFTFRQKFRCFPQSIRMISSALKLRGKCAQSTAAASRREGLQRSPSAARGEPGAALLKEVGPTLPMLQVGQSATRKALPTTRYGRKTHQQVLLFFFWPRRARAGS